MSPGVGLKKHGSQMNICLTNKPYAISCPKRTYWEEKPNPVGKQKVIKVIERPELEAKLDVCTRQIKGNAEEKRHQGSGISQAPSHTPLRGAQRNPEWAHEHTRVSGTSRLPGAPTCPPPAPAGLASAQISLEPNSSSQPPPRAGEMAPRSWKVTGTAVPSSHAGGCPILSGPLCERPTSRTNPS